MRKITIILGPYAPPYGGVATFIQRLYELLIFNNVKFLLLAQSESRTRSKNIVTTSKSPWDILQWLVYLPLARVCFDNLSYFFEYPQRKKAMVWRLLRRLYHFRWIKMIHDGSLPDRYHHFTELQKNVFQKMLHEVDLFITTNETLAQWLRSEQNFSKEIIVIGPLLPFSTQTDDETQFPPGLIEFLESHEKVFVSIGAFDQIYGFHHIAEAIETVRFECSMNIGLILFDGGFTNEPSYEKNVLDNREWIFKTTRMQNEVVLQTIKRCHAFIRACKYESFGLSRVEALLCGTPVIATNVGETRGMMLYEFGDVEKLKELILAVVSSSLPKHDEYWADYFQRSAIENWETLRRIII